MKFAVVGAGAIGAYVGAALARGGADVLLIARGAQLDAIRRDGVHVESARGAFDANPEATDELEAIGDADVVIVALKAYSLTDLAPRLGGALRDGAATIWMQNGIPWWYRPLESVDPGGVIRASIPRESAIGCVVYAATEIESPGVIRHVEGTRFTLGEADGSQSERARAISAAFVAGGLKAPVEEDLAGQIWLKLVGNAALNPVSALTRATLGELGQQPEMVELLRSMFAETAAVASALGVELPVSLERRLEGALEVGDHKTSMLLDLEAGKPLELDCMTGAVIELARELDVPVPRLEAVYACTRLLAPAGSPD
jgi:2-dehydropantoate 2-reductase